MPEKKPAVTPAAFQAPASRRRAALQYVLAGIIAWGLIGWSLDSLLGTRWILPAGIVLGAVSGYYVAAAHRQATDADRPAKGGKQPDTDKSN
ncbi:AtpZ/AtpI family protein [Arthrobacter sp. zg-Y40]|uniref:AtpZ/AtpI family protein n=1 Tax=Arthrobacter sp. zg-Y40 TaxID=2886939 RepID=UPI001D138E5D|nr:AtpZ/AtpI family protein [Arthrobacter sp. zg-Y40]MCC3277628.1 AtpZ/AtpI family protein [Arthrobacter sp. zg-Y40]